MILKEMERLELYNIGLPGQEVYPKAKVPTYRSRMIDSLVYKGLIVENPDFDRTKPWFGQKAYLLTPAGEEVWPTIQEAALKTIERFRKRKQEGTY